MNIIKPLLRQTPLIGAALSFGQTAQNIAACTTPAGKIGYCCKRIIIV